MGKPKTGSRRTLKFQTLDDLLTDAQHLHALDAVAVGGWTPGQIVGHVTAVIEASVKGFPFRLPLPMRILGRVIRKRAIAKGLPSGIKIPGKAREAFVPPTDLTFEDAVAQLAAAVEMAKQRKMTMPSPIFGKLTHEQWVQVHCRHAELHFSFMKPVTQKDEQSHTQANGNNVRHASATA